VSIHVALNHVTHYRYDRPILLSPQVVRLRPAPHTRTPILSYSLRVSPAGHFINWQQDPQSNYLARLVFPEPTRELRIEVDLIAEMSVINPFDFFLEPTAEKIPFGYDEEQTRELFPYLVTLPLTRANAPKFTRWVDDARTLFGSSGKPSVDYLVALIQQMQGDIRYLIRMEPGVQTPEETLQKGSGSCRDTTWLLVQVLRHLGLAARFVSGYLIQLTADVKSLDGPSGPEADFTDLHAWCEVYLPGAGWVGLDATSGLFAGEGHIPLACSPDPSSAAPISGLTEKCKTEFEHHMKVERVWEAPRVTKPYTDDAWSRIESLGHRIDVDLVQHDVRLTMGGEPTFVSVDDRDGPEWNTTADSPPDKPVKRLLGAELLAKLKARYAPGGLLHYGQGKWYPGEQLPRWSLSCFWRRDGEPIWHEPALFADEAIDYALTAEDAARFLGALAKRLKVDAGHVFPAFEDVWYYLWRERQLPVNVDPFDARLEDPLERERLRRLFHAGLDSAVGQVLPLARTPKGDAWQSSPWYLRSDRCFLIPGDSPMGYRLPLDSQPWVSAADFPWVHAPDPVQKVVPLRAPKDIAVKVQTPEPEDTGIDFASASAAANTGGKSKVRAPEAFESAAWITRTALCAQVRHGVMYLFMPPLPTLDDYLELVTAIEITAAECAFPVVLEGYEPPRDPRVEVLRITPDPGVLEVNIQPCHSWDEMVAGTTFLYEAAHECRLGTEKFMIDGRHSGTGGGNHFVLGGATVSDSPFLRRPDLLRSMVSYWHNHPSLSYLFSGLFIGPTSQAPRLDEARNDSVYEMEIAFAEIERRTQDMGYTPPWLIDRILRNLLVDATGNTHRAEFCIDKLFSPDGATGRLGLLEMRGFEMPPHARMSLTQQLLLRALIARFWQKPYAPPRLKRWGTELHDRFMLPHFVWEDMRDVVDDLRAFGYPVELEWFAPHFEFRFPKIGQFAARNVQVDLRSALEPWHVLGEEGGAGGTVRYVDSSVERLQVKVSGLVDDRHVLTVNGRRIPLSPTGQVGEFVAGVRYRAWQPATCLHPTIAPHAPLTFDLVDDWMKRSMGGCQYHVAHPGGRSHESFPVNSYEAEGRRLARFFAMGHTSGHMSAPPEDRNPNLPFTLDLRR
jgi:uncharacterized protein (DUF2126 family)/transglutaminase-like putative cysteine protease